MELLEELGGAPDLVLLFVSSRHDVQKAAAGFMSLMPAQVKLAGCSSHTEINSHEGLDLSVTAMGLQGIESTTLKVDTMQPDSRAAGQRIGAQAKEFGAKLVITFPDGILGNTAEYIRGLQDVLGPKFPIIGGVAAEHLSFVATYEFWNREILCGGAVAVGIRGNLTLATAARSGFQPVGALRTITKMEGKHLILELDNRPALQIYRDFLGDAPANPQMIGIEFPLLVVLNVAGSFMDSDDRSNVVRVVRALDEDKGGLVLGGEVTVGMRVRLTRAVKNDLLRGAVEATQAVLQRVPEPDVAFIFGCSGRKLILGPRYQEEMQAAFAPLGARLPKIGFYTYGEISPVHDVSIYHDETFTIALLKL
jgi:hypothetical protein